MSSLLFLLLPFPLLLPLLFLLPLLLLLLLLLPPSAPSSPPPSLAAGLGAFRRTFRTAELSQTAAETADVDSAENLVSSETTRMLHDETHAGRSRQRCMRPAVRGERTRNGKGKGERRRKRRVRTGAYEEKREGEKGRKGRRAEMAKSDRGTLRARKFLAIRGLMMPHDRAMLARDCSRLA
jgi:hypothetical protein